MNEARTQGRPKRTRNELTNEQTVGHHHHHQLYVGTHQGDDNEYIEANDGSLTLLRFAVVMMTIIWAHYPELL